MSLTDRIRAGSFVPRNDENVKKDKVSRSKLKRPDFFVIAKSQNLRQLPLSPSGTHFCFCKSGENIYMRLSSVFPGMLFVSS